MSKMDKRRYERRLHGIKDDYTKQEEKLSRGGKSTITASALNDILKSPQIRRIYSVAALCEMERLASKQRRLGVLGNVHSNLCGSSSRKSIAFNQIRSFI